MPISTPQKHDGKHLKDVLARHKYTGRDLASAMGLTEESIYYYFGKEEIKRAKVEGFLKKMKIPVTDFYPVNNLVEDHGSATGYSTHQGRNLQTLITAHRYSMRAFAEKTKITHPTLLRYVKEKELDPGYLLLAAKTLGVPVASITGHGPAERGGGDQDVYSLLLQIKRQLDRIESKMA